jgi:hypothetical protein
LQGEIHSQRYLSRSYGYVDGHSFPWHNERCGKEEDQCQYGDVPVLSNHVPIPNGFHDAAL